MTDRWNSVRGRSSECRDLSDPAKALEGTAKSDRLAKPNKIRVGNAIDGLFSKGRHALLVVIGHHFRLLGGIPFAARTV